METLQYIDQYFKGELDAAQARAFEEKILSDQDFAEEVAFYTAAIQAAKLESREEKIKHFRELETKKPGAVIRIFRPLLKYAVAASLLAVVVLGWYFYNRPSSPEKMANEYIRTEMNTLSVSMGVPADSLQSGLQLYNSGEFQKALSVFVPLAAKDSLAEKAIQYAGVTYLRLNRYDSALFYFSRLEDMPHLYSNPGKFYHAIALMKRKQAGDVDKAKVLLHEVVNEDLTGKEQAKKWLEEL